MKIMQKFFLSMLMISLMQPGYSQGIITREEFLTDISLLKEAFLKSGNISFDIGYYYSNEHTPGKYTDTLAGHIEMNGNKSRILVNNTETISTDKYTIVLVKEDKLLYLAKGADSLNQKLNPLAAMDSMFSKIQGIVYRTSSAPGQKIYTLEFPSGFSAKKMEMYVNTRTQHVIKTISTIKTADVLQDPESYNGGDRYEEYTNIETRFTNYRTGIADTAVMTEDYYFTREKDEFKVTNRFKEYTIYKGMPGL